MTGTVEEELNALVENIRKSEYDKDESVLILKEYIGDVIRNNLNDVQRYPVAMTTMDFTKRVKKHDWKFAHGFFGNWAKDHEEDQDVGC